MVGAGDGGGKGAGVGGDVGGDRSRAGGVGAGDRVVIGIGNRPAHRTGGLHRSGDTGDGGGQGNWAIKDRVARGSQGDHRRGSSQGEGVRAGGNAGVVAIGGHSGGSDIGTSMGGEHGAGIGRGGPGRDRSGAGITATCSPSARDGKAHHTGRCHRGAHSGDRCGEGNRAA